MSEQKTFAQEFAEKVLLTTESFALCESRKKNRWHSFMQTPVGKARYIYAIRLDEKASLDIDKNPRLVAIVADGTVHLTPNSPLSYAFKGLLPEYVSRIYYDVQRLNEHIANELFPAFLETIQPSELDENQIAGCEMEARRALLQKKPGVQLLVCKYQADCQDVVNMLCGLDLDDVMRKRMEKDRGSWQVAKARYLKQVELFNNQEVVKDYELKIAEGLRRVDALNVTVEFTRNGKSACEKIDANELVQMMIGNHYFYGHHFSTTSRGNALIKKLGVPTYDNGDEGEKPLTCKDITKITYGKKVLYSVSCLYSVS